MNNIAQTQSKKNSSSKIVFKDRAFCLVPSFDKQCPMTLVDRLVYASENNAGQLGLDSRTLQESKERLAKIDPAQWLRQYAGKTYWSYAYYLPSPANPLTPPELAVWSLLRSLAVEREGNLAVLGESAKGLGAMLGLYRETIAKHLHTLEKWALIEVFRAQYHKGLMNVGISADPSPDWFVKLANDTSEFVGFDDWLKEKRRPAIPAISATPTKPAKPAPIAIKVASASKPTWLDVCPDCEQGSPAENLITPMLDSGLALGKVKDYWTRFLEMEDHCDGTALLKKFIGEARNEHRRNKGNDQFGGLLDWKITQFFNKRQR